jgi:hypothetical protein
VVAAVAVAALAAAACGDSSSSSTSGLGAAGTPNTSSSRPVRFAQCMRSHGLANFPDPTAQGTFNLPPGMTSSPQFASADRACKSLAPAGSLSGQGPTAQELSKAVKFVGCMRKHGEPDFPDPSANGKFQLNGGPNPVQPKSPQFKSAMTACHALLPPGTGFAGTGG